MDRSREVGTGKALRSGRGRREDIASGAPADPAGAGDEGAELRECATGRQTHVQGERTTGRPRRFVEGDEIDVRGHVARIAWIDDEGGDCPVALLVDASHAGGTPGRPFAMTLADLGACLAGFEFLAAAPLDGVRGAEAA